MFRAFHRFSFLLILFLSNVFCGSDVRQPQLIELPGTEELSFYGSVDKIPEALGSGPFSFRFRVYYCPENKPEENAESAHVEKKQPAFSPDCFFRYYERKESYQFGKYFAELRVEEGWTHASVELLGLEAVRGRYSPGHNPFWFTPASVEAWKKIQQEKQKPVQKKKSDDEVDLDQERMTRRKIVDDPSRYSLVHNFTFVSQENPIADKTQAEIAGRFAPILILSRDKKFLPSNLEKFYGKSEQKKYDRKVKDGMPENFFDEPELPYLSFPEEIGAGPTHLYYHLRYASTTVSGTQPEALPGFRDNSNYFYTKGDGSMVLSFWIWFDGNEGPSRWKLGNYHQGDLESFAILLDEKGRPLRLLTTGHDHITLDTAWANIDSVMDHPVLYVGSGNGSDGGNPLSAYGDHTVELDGGGPFLTWLARPLDVFVRADAGQLIVPADLSLESLRKVRIRGLQAETDLSSQVTGRIARLVPWEEPGWINKPADTDPDKHHEVAAEIADFLAFPGRLGKHPRTSYNVFRLRKEGESPRNAPYKTNVEQHYTFERPREERFHSGLKGNYGPR
ncbi:MAG: hypothetical protein HS115_14675 [Spirochaetales bacterium]|nr:hypothetical protein [Spirochaetales bacterium]